MTSSVPADVTFIFPVRNGSNYLAQAIESVLKQTYQNWQAIVVDNVSDDDTPALAKSYLSDPRFRFVANEKNLGVQGNFIKALSLVNTPYYCYVCHDDKFLDPTTVERAKAILDANPSVVMVNSPMTWIDQNSKAIAAPAVAFKGKVASDDVARYCMVTTRNPYGVLLLARPQFGQDWKAVPALPGTWDLDYFIHLGRGRDAWFLEESAYGLRFHPSNNTMRDFSTTLGQVNLIAKRYGIELSAWERFKQRLFDWRTRVSKHIFYFYLDHVRR